MAGVVTKCITLKANNTQKDQTAGPPWHRTWIGTDATESAAPIVCLADISHWVPGNNIVTLLATPSPSPIPGDAHWGVELKFCAGTTAEPPSGWLLLVNLLMPGATAYGDPKP